MADDMVMRSAFAELVNRPVGGLPPVHINHASRIDQHSLDDYLARAVRVRVAELWPLGSQHHRDGTGRGRMRFTSSYPDAAAHADIHFVCVPTPQKRGGLAADLTATEAAITTLAAYANRPTLIVGKSSVPVGTTARLSKLAEQAAAPGVTVDVAWSPDFLRESTSLRDAAQPSRLIAGVSAGRSDIEQTLRTVWAPWLNAGVPLIVTDPATAELAKSAANAFLATKISFINAMAAICEAASADISTLSRSLALDPRIGPAMLDAGLGFGGSCIPKDLRALAARTYELHVPEARFLREVDAINIRRRRRVLAIVRNACGGDVIGKRIALWGAAFKPGTDDIRDSPALAVAADLIAAGADVAVHDPKALRSVRVEHPLIDCVEDLAEVLDGCSRATPPDPLAHLPRRRPCSPDWAPQECPCNRRTRHSGRQPLASGRVDIHRPWHGSTQFAD